MTERPDWRSILELSQQNPELSRIVGLFSSADDLASGGLLGFAWGARHGDHVEYRAAGMTRVEGRNISVGYPLMWALILWAKQEGAAWFDMGGVTLPETPNDPLAGISDFKRMFSQVTEEVGEEWYLEPHPAKTRLASLLGKGGRQAASLLGKIQSRKGAA
ncbi:hypothetical protein GRAN_3702 [Granulicella sibirica]|uniref:BioF2-like acetyltransferase domain-containing protein n=1 Tax=Granulicella sibirica TaxID=2479048 RepID=A0A4Q0SY92_9BACT|nr:hypothetical protein GRAN_3702 [Granulicella sibirica]